MPLNRFEDGPPFRAVAPPLNVKVPRGPLPDSGCQWFIPYRLMSGPKRMSCFPLLQLALAVYVYV